jgi:type II secretion system protein I
MILRRLTPTRRGLSLLEVLLSLAILVIALVAISRLVNIGAQRGAEARAHSRGVRLAEAKMAEVEAGVIPLDGEASGQFDGDDAIWSYTVSSEATGPPNLYNVTVRVTRDLQGKPFEVSLSQLVFDPAFMGSSAQAELPAVPTDDETGMGMGMTPGGTSP